MSKRYVLWLQVFFLSFSSYSFVCSIFTFVQIIRRSAFGWHSICFALTNGQLWSRGKVQRPNRRCGCYPWCNFMVRLELHIHNIKPDNSRKWHTNAKNDDNEYSRFSPKWINMKHTICLYNDMKAGYQNKKNSFFYSRICM